MHVVVSYVEFGRGVGVAGDQVVFQGVVQELEEGVE